MYDKWRKRIMSIRTLDMNHMMFRCLKCCTLVSTVHWLDWVLTDWYSHAESCYSQVVTAWRRSKGYSVLQTSVTELHRVTDCPRPVNTLSGWLHWAEQREHLLTRLSYCYCELEPARPLRRADISNNHGEMEHLMCVIKVKSGVCLLCILEVLFLVIKSICLWC